MSDEKDVSVAELIDWLRHGSRGERRSAAGLLGRRGVGSSAAVTALAEALAEEGDDTLRRLAAAALGDIGPAATAAVPALTAAARDRLPELRRRAVLALAEIGGPGTREVLVRALTDADERVRRAATAVLSSARRAA